MHITHHKPIQPLAWVATIVTEALAWMMALTLWLTARLSRTRETPSASQTVSPASHHGTNSPMADDGHFSRSYEERFSRAYFGRYR